MLRRDSSIAHSYESLRSGLERYEPKGFFSSCHGNYMSKMRDLNIVKKVRDTTTSRNNFEFEDDALVKLRSYLKL